jgi:hypothetical protein
VTHEERSPGALNISRRDALSILAGAAIGGGAIGGGAIAADSRSSAANSNSAAKNFRIRTLTAGTPIADFADTHSVEAALDFLASARRRFEQAGYIVQTTRVALNPLLVGASTSVRSDAMAKLVVLDGLAAAHGAVISIGPVFSAGDVDESIGAWALLLARSTKVLSFSGSVASAVHGVHRDAVIMAAQVISALTDAGGGGIANFRFAAAACVPAGTPFFPVAYHDGPPSLAVGLETPNLVREAFIGAGDPADAASRFARRATAARRETRASDRRTRETPLFRHRYLAGAGSRQQHRPCPGNLDRTTLWIGIHPPGLRRGNGSHQVRGRQDLRLFRLDAADTGGSGARRPGD